MPSPATIPQLAPGQRILVRSSLRLRGRETLSHYTVVRVGAWLVELTGPLGGDAQLVTVEATGEVRLLRGREERAVSEVRLAPMQVAA